ncbi:MAG: hypothetical protein ACXVCO_13725 [Ktedonobacterales bacterium]
MTWLLNALTGLPAFLQGLLGWLNKKEDTAVVENNNAKDVSVAIVQNDTAHAGVVKDVTLAMMDHPVFWVAWGLGVFPVLLYHACIYFVSTFPFWGWTVLKVPHDELAFGQMVIGSVFTLTGVSSVVAGLAHAWIKRA